MAARRTLPLYAPARPRLLVMTTSSDAIAFVCPSAGLRSSGCVDIADASAGHLADQLARSTLLGVGLGSDGALERFLEFRGSDHLHRLGDFSDVSHRFAALHNCSSLGHVREIRGISSGWQALEDMGSERSSMCENIGVCPKNVPFTPGGVGLWGWSWRPCGGMKAADLVIEISKSGRLFAIISLYNIYLTSCCDSRGINWAWGSVEFGGCCADNVVDSPLLFRGLRCRLFVVLQF